MINHRHSLLFPVLATACAPAGVLALEAKVSGHVNRALMWADDGAGSEVFFVDNGTSSTRFRFVGEEQFDGNTAAGINFEVEWVSNNSSDVTLQNRDPGTELNERHMDVYYKGDFGKVSLGQGDGAANGGIEVDQSGTGIIHYAGIDNIGGSITFQDAGAAGPSISAVLNNYDFESRFDRLRYDAPAFGAVTLSVAVGTSGGNDVVDFAARYAGEVGKGRVAAALGASSEDQGGATGNEDTVGGSVSWLAAGGFNLTFAYSTRRNDANLDGTFTYLKAGYIYDRHAVAVDYAMGADQVNAGDEAKMLGVGYVFKPIAWAELYAGAKVHGFDRSGAGFDDITVVTAGSRIKF